MNVQGRIPRTRAWVALACGLALATAGGGCALGPKALEKSHGKYVEAVRQVEEEQFLRNLVHLRYNENNLSLHVSSIAAQFELSASVEAHSFFGTPNPSSKNVFHTFTRILPFASLSGADRPTITLLPADNGESVRKFLTPISADTIAFLTRTSWPVTTVIRLWVERINGVPNAVSATGPPRDVVSEFDRFRHLTDLMQIAQDQEMLSMDYVAHETPASGPWPASAMTAEASLEAAKSGYEYRTGANGTTWTLMRKENQLVLNVHASASQDPVLQELRTLLNLHSNLLQYPVEVAPGNLVDPMRESIPQSATIRIMPRSTCEVLFYLANSVEIPEEHLALGIVRPRVDSSGRVIDGREVTQGLLEIHTCKGHRRPSCAYVAIKHRGYWYYIDDRDQVSKATLLLMLQLNRLDFGYSQPTAPLLTLPVGR